MRKLRNIHSSLNEDNKTGFHNRDVVSGVHRPVTGGNDAPPEVGFPEIKAAAEDAKNKVVGSVKASVGGADKAGNVNINQTQNIYMNGEGGAAAAAGGANPDGLGFFAANWKAFAITAASAAIIAGIVALVKAFNKSIKARYNKVVRTLQRAQNDFTLKKSGLSMAAVLPGVGSKINDWLTRTLTGNWKSKKNTKGNIGLHPFCDQYKEEIANDFRMSQEAFNKIRLAADENGNAPTDSTDSVGPQGESVETKRYNTFREALMSDPLNESMTPEQINESIVAAISAGVGLASLAVKGGAWVINKMKDGKPVPGEGKTVNVTKESTREICYAIIHNYADKYVNMSQVFKELGISSESLADLDKSSVDKLSEILRKYSKPEGNRYTTQYARIKSAYDKMLEHYFKIGDGIITNFVKYSEGKDEKHSNLIVASKEKLQNMWDSQKEFYQNNFSHIIIEIVSCDAYINYLNFILEQVIPVFRTGLAGDADYILDVMPKPGEFYVLRQTLQDGPLPDNTHSDVSGKVGVAKVVGCDEKAKKIKFEMYAALKDNTDYRVDGDGTATIATDDLDFDAYKSDGKNKEVELEYNRWLSMDPIIVDPAMWSPDVKTKMWFRQIADKANEKNKNVTQIVFATTTVDAKNDMYSTAYVVFMDQYEAIRGYNMYKIATPFNLNTFETRLADVKDKDGNSEFQECNDYVTDVVNGQISAIKPESKEIKDIVEFVKALNERSSGDTPTLTENAEKLVEKIKEGIKDINMTAEEFEEKDLLSPKGKLVGKAMLPKNANLPVEVDTESVIPDKDKLIKLYVYTILNSDDKKVYLHILANKGASFAETTCSDSDEDITKALGILDEILHGAKKDDPLFQKLVKKEEPAPAEFQLSQEVGNKLSKNMHDLWQLISVGVNGKFGLNPRQNGATSLNNVRMNVTKPDPFAAEVQFVDMKVKDTKGKELSGVKFAMTVNGDKLILSFGNIKSEVDYKHMPDVTPLKDGVTALLKGVYDEQAKAKKQIVFEHSVISNGNHLDVTRKIDMNMRGWTILSESVYGEYGGAPSKLDDENFVRVLKTKDDCTAFAKSHKNAHLTEGKRETSYSINTPTYSMPIYESVVLVKFDKDNNIVEKINLGKKKIY